MILIVAGGGRTGTQLASILLRQGHEIRLIEHRKDILARLHRELPTEVIFEGNPADPRVLDQVGAREVQVLAACTTEDSDNLAICFIAREIFKVPRTIARINNPKNEHIFKLLGIDQKMLTQGGNIQYIKDTTNAIEDTIYDIDGGDKQVAFFTNAVTIQQLKMVTDAGERMPQKATYFPETIFRFNYS